MMMFEPEEPTDDEIALWNQIIKDCGDGLISADEAASVLETTPDMVRYWLSSREPERTYEELSGGDLPF